ncbi:Tyrocidine synthase 3 [Kordia antarctica]|uniref:Tyrocidine synthase 3 n=1 Tax=Kordia antarctica TaxID=1218801 RepID=A0A7L4ZF98_9FLAO|nr:non-ribosomal peptide synthetase [Kordia antarctica]QHI35408.1 Tyrocidine synthase 3 [Kordia antarctica]
MKKLKNIIYQLHQQNIKLTLNGDNIEVASIDNKISPEQIQLIKSHKSELIEYLKTLENNNNSMSNIAVIPTSQSYKMSDAQRRLWLVCQMQETSIAYNLPISVELKGTYDRDCFVKAIEATIERHEILRTVFKEDAQGEIRQWIVPANELDFKVDYQDYQEVENPEEASKKYIADDSYKLFNLENGPLIRASLHHLSADSYVFYYNMHHIISDGWSLDVLGKDVMTYYNAYKNDTTPELTELRIQYKDYVVWSDEQHNKEATNESKEFWSQKLAGELPTIDLPGQKLRPKFKTSNGHVLQTIVPATLSTKLNNFLKEQQGSLFTGLIAALKTTLYKYTAKRDIIIGSPVAGRNHPELEDQIGFYVNNLVLRNEIDANDSFLSFYSNVKKNTLESFEHALYPFDLLIEDVGIVYDMSRTPIFDISLTLHNPTETESNEPLNTNKVIDLGKGVCKNDIEFHFRPIGDCISIIVKFNKDIYDTVTIANFLKHFKQLLAEVLEKPHAKLDQITYLSPSETDEILTVFNINTLAYPKEETLVSLFTKQAVLTPDTKAIVFNNTSLTYKELDEVSNQLAHCFIKEHNIESNDTIAVKLDRSEQFIITILAILKAGASYIPIDTNYPQERKEFILNDAKVKMLVTDSNYIFDLDYYEGNLFAIDIDFEAAEYDKTQPTVEVKASDVAYIIYTSGSTGTPKGVMIQHKGIVNTAMAIINGMNLKECKHSLQFASYSFDASVFETYNALLSGSTLYMVDENTRKTPALLEQYIIDHKIETATLPPSYLKLMNMESLKSLKVLVTAGEAAVYDKVMEYLEFGGVYYNAYGPTETSICSCAFKMTKGTEVSGTQIPIGTPIANVQMYVLDAHNHIQPKGVVGELCISGAGLAKGYLNREELTAEKFISHPYISGERLYKTGDMGRMLENGAIEFVGRVDDQVKIRGHRIELGEVSYQLESKEDIEEVALLVIDDEAGDKELVAYIVSKKEQNTIEIRQFLSKRLPDYMLPSQYIQVDKILLNTSGKVDRKALIALNAGNLSAEVEYVAPRNEIEEKVHEIWSSILKIEKISVKGDFFVLGGQSLKATSLINEYQKAFGAKLTLKELFENITLESHATMIASANKVSFESIPEVVAADNYKVSRAQHRLWVQSQFEDASMAYNIPLSIRTNIENVESFEKAIHAVIERHEILRTVFRKNEEGELRQWVLDPSETNFAIAHHDMQHENNPDAEIRNYIQQDSHVTFDLEKGPLFRVAIFKASHDSYTIYYNMHHIISDGWSMNILSKDIMSYYEAFKQNKTPNLAELNIQYKDYAAWQYSKLKEEAFETDQTYWLNEFSEEQPFLDLPFQKQRPQLKTYDGDTLETYLSLEQSKGLKTFLQSQNGSLFTGVLALCNVLFYKYTGFHDITIGTIVAGRDHADLTNQIGCYVNSLALKNKIIPTESFQKFNKKVATSTLTAFNHQAYPFDQLIEDLNVKGDLSRNPLFDVLLVVQNTGEDEKGSEITIESSFVDEIFHRKNTKSKFDIQITFNEIGEHISFSITYNTALYEETEMRSLMMHFKKLVSEVLTKPEKAVGELAYLSENEQQQLLVDFNPNSDISYPKEETIVSIFEKQVQLRQHETAVAFEDKKLSYLELDTAVNQLANYLKDSCDIQPQDLISVELARSEWLIVSILAVLKLGAAYVPIDPAYPQERINYIRKDSNCKLSIDEATLNAFRLVQAKCSIEKPSNALEANHLAYVIYTSGTTGNPKGVLIEHESVVRLLYNDAQLFDFKATDVWCLFHSYCFDFSAWEIFGALLYGSKLVVVPSMTAKDTKLFAELLSKENVTVLNQTPSVFKILQSEMVTSKIAHTIRYVIFAGEALMPEITKDWHEAFPSCKLVNMYGITEGTVHVTYKEITMPEIIANKSNVGIGIPTISCYVLDENLQLVPIGVNGELYVSGVGIARGYLNRPELTEERFIKHPFKTNERLYKTGDVACWLPNGDMEYKGRIDDQVKIRGHRIELKEIEFQLLESESIQQCVVLAQEDKEGEKNLVAYLISDQKETTTTLRTFLSNKLPEYMLPSYFIQVDEFPLTSNGKIDKSKLSNIVGRQLESNVEYTAPRNEAEERLIEILSVALDTDASKIGIHDNFFDMGMNSIKLIQILENFNKEFNTSIKPISLFEHTTVDDFISNVFSNEDQEKTSETEFQIGADLSEELDDFITSMNE